MRIAPALALLPLASAFVIHDAEVFKNIEKSGRRVIGKGQSVIEDTLGSVKTASEDAYDKIHKIGCDIESWLEDTTFDDPFIDTSSDHEHPHPPHKGKPHHPPHHSKPNLTVYELIAKSNYTTKLAKLLDDYPDLVDRLNSTTANYTIFAPIDSAFDKIPSHAPKPSKEDLEKVLIYHISDSFYPAARVLHSYTIPTLYTPSSPANLGHAQRLTVRITLRGPAINFYSKLVAVNIFGTNGVIHGIDSLLIPPPNVGTIIDLLPGEFSTLELALGKTGLFDKVNSTEYPHNGGTFFAPSNSAFKKLGPRVNAFLFSKYGQKYLKALLEYHIVVDQTLYSDAFFDGTGDDGDDRDDATARPPYYHLDLPTVLDGKSLAVDITRYGPFVSIRLNGFSRVTVHDGVASDGVIQVVSDVLIPPKKPHGDEEAWWVGGEMSVEEFKERLEPFVGENLEL
ncbi:Fasciclin-domain-containing protein [Byssothecium circinans]|uniref:Fasciclin-domain-containing protein n=1 Tax=Byssothecium circinans TaxID=147558 RepID=A0A6A5UE49_9PLEO|nr:Fasciclin-domain-containing protein [Byssothecium circinans]